MADVFTKAKRSEVMSRIRSRGNKDTELRLIAIFRAYGITGWRRQRRLRITHSTSSGQAPAGLRNGKAAAFAVNVDFVFPKQHVAVFVDGCFWHGCPVHATQPRNNAAFWRKKFAANKARDLFVTRTLRRDGWRVLRIWEHELASKNERRLAARLRRMLD